MDRKRKKLAVTPRATSTDKIRASGYGVTAYSFWRKPCCPKQAIPGKAADSAPSRSRGRPVVAKALMADTVARASLCPGKPDEARSKLVSVVGEARKFGYRSISLTPSWRCTN